MTLLGIHYHETLFCGHDFYTVVTTLTSHVYCLIVIRLIIEVGKNIQFLKNNENTNKSSRTIRTLSWAITFILKVIDT